MRDDTIRDEQLLRNKVVFYKENEVSVHLSLQKRFYNGIVIEVHEDYFILDDEVIGEIPVYFDELLNVEKRREKI